MRYLLRNLIISTLVLGTVELSAQSSTCGVSQVAIPYFGWDGTECTSCVIRGSYIEYLKEPLISSIRADGPAAGRLREHDMLLAVDGLAITTPEAWHRLRDVKPGENVRFTVRNEGTIREEIIFVSSRCLAAPEPRIVVIRRKGGRV